MTLTRAVILHGYLATPDDHWFAWLAERLTAADVSTVVPALPRSSAPDRDAWVAAATEAIGEPSDDLLVVAHSLGSLTALHALDAFEQEWSMGALIMVSGFADPLPALPELDAFIGVEAPDIARTAARVRHRAMLASDNDELVPPAHSASLATRIGTEVRTVPGAGHFLGDEGFAELPEVWETVPLDALTR